jgi:porin
MPNREFWTHCGPHSGPGRAECGKKDRHAAKGSAGISRARPLASRLDSPKASPLSQPILRQAGSPRGAGQGNIETSEAALRLHLLDGPRRSLAGWYASAAAIMLAFALWPTDGRAQGLLVPTEPLQQRGVTLNASVIQFGQGFVAGEGDARFETGGRLNARVDLDGAKLGLWEGFSVNLVGELGYGENVNTAGGTLFLENTALFFPANGETAGDLSLTLTQQLGRGVSVAVGKFNMVDAASRTPIAGGGGIDTFWNVALAAPVTGLIPPYVTGAQLSVRTRPVLVTLMVYDPDNAQQVSGLDDWGADGVTGRLALMFPKSVAGRSGFHTITLVGSTKTGVDLADIPELALPPSSAASLGTKKGSYFAGYAVQQFVWQDATQPGVGWGLFGQAGISDRNPNPFGWMMVAGVGATGVFAGRSADRFGVGYFRYSLSDYLTDGLRVLGVIDLGDEQGIETFYNVALTPWLRLSGDLQVVRPGPRHQSTAVFVGVSGQVRF